MIRKISTYLLALVFLALTACHDDFSSPTGGGVDDDGNLHISFSLSDMEVVGTRAADGISSIYMYAFDSNSPYALRQKSKVEITEGWTSNSNSCTGKVLLNSSVLNNLTKTDFVFVANTDPGTFDGFGDLEGETTRELDEGGLYLLSSNKESYTTVSQNSVALIHNAVKVTVHEAKKDNNGAFIMNGTDYTLGTAYDFNVAGAAGESSIIAGGMGLMGNSSKPNYDKFSVSSGEKLIHPTVNTGEGQANSVFVIAKAKYQNKDYYYRLDFQKKEKKDPDGSDALSSGNITTKPFDVLPNHWYQFVVKNITGPGYETPEEAAKNPTPMIDYEIHDHSPKIFNMISDGSRELGVSKAVTNNNSAINSTAILNIKLFSLNSGEDAELPIFSGGSNTDWKKFIKIDDECGWLTVESISQNTTDEGNNHPDNNSTGKLYDVTLKFLNTKNPGKLKTTLTITWRGLTREVPVVWNREFDPADLFESVKIKAWESQPSKWDSTSKWGEYDYFTYKEDGTEKGFFKQYAYGTTAQQNNGENREDGFHFPMPYGKSSLYKYMYKVELNNDLVGNGQKWSASSREINGVQFSINGESDWSASLTEQPYNRTVFYMRCTDDSYDYQIGKLVLKVTDGTNEATYDNVKIYHTGFFWHDKSVSENSDKAGGKTFVKGNVNSGMGYYEVFTCGSDHWLDRNIGASAANSYIIGGMGSDDSAGYYIVGAEYDMHNDPIIYEGMCPDGYTVPSVDQWDNLRNSSNFTITLVTSFYNPSYAADKGKVVYFPKAQYEDGGSLKGEVRAGYYWTRTAAVGTEKQEIGNWLKCLSIAGTATSYINGKVNGKDSGTGYYMSLRGVTPDNSTSTVNRVSFFVTGATHVYLYTEDALKRRNAVTEWPGQAVGNYLTMVNNQRFNFTYESKVLTINDLKVIFNFVDANGTIHTYSKNNFNSGTTHTNINPDVAQGWDVKGSSQADDFEPTYADCKVKIDTPTSGNNTVWACGGQDFGATEPTLYRILWPKTEEGFEKISISGTNVTNASATSTDYSYDDKKWCSYDYKTTATDLSFKLTFTNAAGDIVTPQGNPTYTLEDMTTSINGANGLVIESLPGTTPPVAKFNAKFAWYKDDYYQYARVYDVTDSKWILGSATSFVQKNGDGNWNRTDNGNNISAWSYYGQFPETSKGHQVRIYISGSATGENIKETTETRELTANDPFWVLGGDNFQTSSGGGGDDPNPSGETVEYRLAGNGFGGWADGNRTSGTVMTPQSDGTYTWTGNASGEFGIRKITTKNGNYSYEWIWCSESSQKVVYNKAMSCAIKNNNNGGNWVDLEAGERTFTFNPSAMTLTITGSNSGGETYNTYRFYWYKGWGTPEIKRKSLWMWNLKDTGAKLSDDSAAPGDAGKWVTSLVKDDNTLSMHYIEFTVPTKVSDFQVNFIICGDDNWKNKGGEFWVKKTAFKTGDSTAPDKYIYKMTDNPGDDNKNIQ